MRLCTMWAAAGTPLKQPTPTHMKQEAVIRATIVQPSLAKYRVPVFRELASRAGLEVRVVYGSLEGLENVEPQGFDAMATRLYKPTLAGKPLMLQPAQWANASRVKCDVLVLQWSGRYLTLFPTLLRARLNGVGTVLWGHGYSKSQGRPRARFHKWLAKFATAILFYDPRTRDAYIEQGWEPRNLFVALNCLDPREIVAARQWWQEHPCELDQFRRRNQLDQGPVILFVSRLQPANRVDWLIRATAELSKELPNLKTVILGNGAAEKDRLQQIAQDVDAHDNVLFLDGIYDETKLAPWFLSADVFCYPANVGLSLIHALWYGLPVVTTDDLACQNPEVFALQHGVTGLTYEHGNVSSLAAALRKILRDDTLRKSMADAARRAVENRFTIVSMVDGLEAAIRFAHLQNRSTGRQ